MKTAIAPLTGVRSIQPPTGWATIETGRGIQVKCLTGVFMELGAQLRWQRVKHIVSSYQLDGHDQEAFEQDLQLLFAHYPSPLIELALVETLVDGWLQVPLLRGCEFLAKVFEQLQQWEEQSLLKSASVTQQRANTISPDQFQQITGLDPTPIFGSARSSSQPSLPSSGSNG